MSRFAGPATSVPIPPCRDPFVNTPLLPLPKHREDEPQRFWISSYNGAFGCLGVVIDSDGNHEIYRTGNFRRPGFYSSAVDGPNDLWLCGMADEVVHLDLSTGQFTGYKNDVPRSLVFAGMALDPATKKLFAGSFSDDFVCWSFDTTTGQTDQVYRNITEQHYLRHSFPNGDGTWSFVLYVPGFDLLRWDPATGEVSTRRMLDELDMHKDGQLWYRLIADGNGRRYFPRFGWYNGRTDAFEEGPEPDVEAAWIDANEQMAVGFTSGNTLVRWDFASNTCEVKGELEGASLLGTRLTEDGHLAWMSKDGFFSCYDVDKGELVSRHLVQEAVEIQAVDCVVRLGADSRRIVGTPFITQRFWMADLDTGEGEDCGRAAPGGGEILETWWLNGAAYWAAYAGGQLLKYDPEVSPRYPENPYVVADPSHAMRPVAAADDGQRLWYACSRPYGELGSTVTRYDTQTGRTMTVGDPLPHQQIRSLVYDPQTGSLLGGSTNQADCNSAPPNDDRCRLFRLNAETLQPIESVPAPEGVGQVQSLGRLADGRAVWVMHRQAADGSHRWHWWAQDGDELAEPNAEDLLPLPEQMRSFYPVSEPGLFVCRFEHAAQVWRLPEGECLAELSEQDPELCKILVQEPDVFLVRPWNIVVLESALSPDQWR